MLVMKNISKLYRTQYVETTALNDVNLEVAAGEFIAIMGPSGCGKSTLLNILGLLDTPTAGTYEFNGQSVSARGENELVQLRRGNVGFVFQSFNLIDDLTIAENVEVPLLYLSMTAPARRKRALEMLRTVNLDARAEHFPKQLSGGQQQRAAIARALASSPKILLADEPTGNLDTANGDGIMALLDKISRDGTTVIMVTHSEPYAKLAKRTIRLLDGRIEAQNFN